MKPVTITLPFGEKVSSDTIFSNPENYFVMDDPEIMDNFNPIETIYRETHDYWRDYEKKHGRHVYDFDTIIVLQIMSEFNA